jgi:hypothetical protein
MADKKGGPVTDAIMSAAEMKPLLMLSKREPVNAVIGMTKDHDGLILLSKRVKPKKLVTQLKADARKAKIELDLVSLRFGKAEVDTDKDSGMVVFTVNRDPPGALRMKLLEVLKRVPYSKIEIDVDAKIDAEPEDDDTPAEAAPTVDLTAAARQAAEDVEGTDPPAPAWSAPTVPPPPEGVLERKGDGGLYWEPNLAPATWGAGGPPAPSSWIDGFFAYYNLAPPPDPNPDATQDCIFNQAPSSLQAVLDTLDQQATLAGYTASRGTAQTAAQKLLAGRAGGRQAGAAMAQRGPTADDVAALEKLDTAALLDALETLRKAHKLDALAELAPADQRLEAAILAVQRHLGAKFQALMHALSDDDQKALRQHVYQGLIAGDMGDNKKLVKAGGGGTYSAPDASDADWVEGFLTFYGLQADPFDKGMHETCMFNSQTQNTVDMLDTVVEQAALDGHLINRGLVSKIAIPMILPPPVPGPGSSHRFTYYLGIGVIPWTGHKDLKTGDTSHDTPGEQLSAQVTLELHPKDASGPELSVVAQVTTFDDPNKGPWKVQNYIAGFQAAWVKSWFDGMLQLSPLVQVLGGAMRAQQAKDGSLQMVAGGQVMLGGQLAVQFDIPHTNLKMQIGLQAGVSATDASGANPTLDGPITIGVQLSYTKP